MEKSTPKKPSNGSRAPKSGQSRPNRNARPNRASGSNNTNAAKSRSFGGKRPNTGGKNNNRNANRGGSGNANAAKPRAASKASRGAAMRAQRRSSESAHKMANLYQDATAVTVTDKGRANKIDDTPKLRVIGMGGMDGGGSKNMILVEYENDALIMDVGIDLGVDLPGINFGIPDTTYLDKIKHKIKAYVITHGHLDHIGGMPYIVTRYPAPVYGSRFTIGRVEEIFKNSDYKVDGFELKTVVMNQDNHERLRVGASFTIELVRVTHSIPGSTAIVVDTPEGRLINTGDFRIDPEPLDHLQTDIARFEELGREGVLCLMSESTTTERPGRTPTEQTIQPAFQDIFKNAPGRVFIGVFSTNINRIQMVVNAAVENGRRVVMDGRSMISTLETAVRLGFVKIPKGTFVPMANVNTLRDEETVVICTGSQGEPNSALMRMSSGDHNHIKLKSADTVVLSSSPIPETGNDAHIGRMVDDLMRKKVHVFRHETHEIDGCGPLHVSGHASIEEYGDMIDMTKPKFFLPIMGSYRSKQRHIEIAVERGIPRKDTYNAENGEVIEFANEKMTIGGVVEHGTLLVDNTGALVSNVVVKDRLMLAEEGLASIILTIDKRTGQLLSSPDIISRGFIYMRDNEELMNDFRAELRRVVSQRFKRVDLERFKQELRDHIMYFLYERTQRTPIVVPVVNVVGGKGEAKKMTKRQAELRQEMLGSDQAD